MGGFYDYVCEDSDKIKSNFLLILFFSMRSSDMKQSSL